MNLFHSIGLLLFCLIMPLRGGAQDLAAYAKNQATPPTSQTNSINTYTFKQLGWDSTVTLNGYQPSTTLYLPLAKRLNVQKIVLHLTMTFAPELTEGTRVDIKFNQTLIGSISLPADANKVVSRDIELPLTQLSQAWQALSFSAYLNSGKHLCDPNIWVYISPKSSLTINTAPLPFHGLLNALPYPFIDEATITPVSTKLLLTKTADLQEIFSLLQISLKLGELAGDTKIDLSSGTIDEPAEQLKNNNLIVIGTSQHLLESAVPEFTALMEDNEIKSALTQNDGILLLNPSPFNTLRGLLTITGVNDEALEKATKAFLASEFNTFASGKLAIIHNIELKKTIKPIGESYETTLKELGYSDISVSGLGRHHLTYNIPLPNDRVPDFASTKTFITTPVFSIEGLSQITLLMNGQKQSSFGVNGEHSAWYTDIDTSAMKPGINKLEYFIDLHFENNGYEQCNRANYDEVWATIHAQTIFKTSFFNDLPQAMLNELPVPFNTEITAILPMELTSEDINTLSNLFFKFGQLFQPDTIHFSFRGSHQVTEEFIRTNNVIILGTINTNPWIQYTLDYMPVQLKGNSRFLKLSQKQLQISGDKSTGLLELVPSPWSENHAILLIAGNNNIGFSNAVNALINDRVRVNLNGNIALINPDQTFETLNSYENRYISPKHRFMISLKNMGKNLFYKLTTHPQILIYLLVFLIPLIIVFRNRKK